jgi:5-methyltetrahydropteroyltriglutamate--homocysteine methyltransferase
MAGILGFQSRFSFRRYFVSNKASSLINVPNSWDFNITIRSGFLECNELNGFSKDSFNIVLNVLTFMGALIDDVGSFPLPSNMNRETFDRAYRLAREVLTRGKSLRADAFVWENFGKVTVDAFVEKCLTGVDVVNYPQQYDGIKQVSDSVHVAMERGTFVVEERDAFLPEVELIKAEAASISEKIGGKIHLRVCLFGPMEQYLKEMGTIAYADVLDGFAETIRRFAKNSVLNEKHVKTEVVSIDEPSFGFLDVAAEKETLITVLNKAFDFSGAVRQVHLHSASRLADCLQVRNIDVVSFEGAGSPRNVEAVSKRMLDEADKQIRVGVARTDVDSLLAELNDKGVSKPTAEQLVENEAAIRKRFLAAKEKFGEQLAFAGPDCGLGSWPSQEAALLLLRRTVAAVKNA